ncbi:MAG: RNA polymerase sigma factor (sigma-70 family) [Planctomycetota bacterium]
MLHRPLGSPNDGPRTRHIEPKQGVTRSLNDDELVKGLTQRDDYAVSIFLERYRALFFHCISHFEADPSARDDLYQELVLYVLERLDRDRFDRTKGNFGTWLYRVSWCRCVDLKRKQGARCRPRLAAVGDDLPDQPDEHPSPAETAETVEMGEYVRVALTHLETEERILLEERFVNGRTLAEIARQLSISLEQTKYRLRRATIAMRRVLVNDLSPEEARDA